MIGIILAAGKGERLTKDTGIEIAKALVQVGGKRLIEFALENMLSIKVEKIYIVVGEHKSSIIEAVGDEYKGIPVYYVVQSKAIGLMNAVSKVLPFCDTDAAVYLSDEIFLNSNPSLLDEVKTRTQDFICGIVYEKNPEKIKGNYSVLCDEEGFIVRTKEKPKEIINNIKGTGFCIFGKDCMDILKQNYTEELNQPCDLCDFMNLLISSGKKGKCLEIAEEQINVNTKQDLDYALKTLEK